MPLHKMQDKPVKSWPRSFRARLCAWLGAVALSLQAAVPLGQASASKAAGDGLASPAILCDLLGGVTKAPLGDGKKHGPYGSPLTCLVCQVRDLGQGLIAALPAALPEPLVFAFMAFTASQDHLAAFGVNSVKHPRAPPLSA